MLRQRLYINNTDLYDISGFNYILWSLCGVDLVEEQCAPSPIVLPPTPIDPTCTETEFTQRVFSNITCKRSTVESVTTAVQTSSCADNIPDDFFASLCAVNQIGGDYCNAEDLDVLFEVAAANCANTSVCAPLCTETLNNITATAGCCFNNEYNGTDIDETSRPDFLSDQFWSMCDLSSPGLCEIRLTGEPSTISQSTQSPSQAMH